MAKGNAIIFCAKKLTTLVSRAAIPKRRKTNRNRLNLSFATKKATIFNTLVIGRAVTEYVMESKAQNLTHF